MTVIREKRYEKRIHLPRKGPDEFWQKMQQHYARCDSQTWKHLAMLALRENAGWPIRFIAKSFGHTDGYVTRNLAKVKGEIRLRFKLAPEMTPTEANQESHSEHGRGE